MGQHSGTLTGLPSLHGMGCHLGTVLDGCPDAAITTRSGRPRLLKSIGWQTYGNLGSFVMK